MAKEATGKTVKQLKQERTLAKSAFTKHANFLSRAAGNMTRSELQEEFKKLMSHVRNVSESNDDYNTGLLADLEVEEEGEEAKLDLQQQIDLEKTIEDCDARLEEVRSIVQSNLWSRYGEEELKSAIKEAEEACEGVGAVAVSAVNKDGYELRFDGAKKLVQDAIASLAGWEIWIPAAEKSSLDGRVKGLRTLNNHLDARRAEFLTAQRIAEEERRRRTQPLPVPAHQQIVQIKPISLPKFDGFKRNFHRWRKDWESLQRQGEPTGSGEAKKIQLLDSVDDKISRDLRLSTYNTAEDLFRVLENRYGNKTTIALEIIEDLEKIPPLKSWQPRKVIDMIQSVEKALNDLTELGNTGAIKNPLVVRSIESKLPDSMKKDWLVFMVNPENAITPDNHFDSLLKFLKTQEEILEKLEQLGVGEKPDKKVDYTEKKYASTRSTTKGGCVVCGDEKHREKIFFCKRFKELKPNEKLNAVEKLGACKKCLGCHDDDGECKDTYLCKNWDCRRGSSADHHFFLCRRGDSKRSGMDRPQKSSASRHELTDDQETFVSELSPEMAGKFRRAFTNITAKTHCADKPGLMESSALQELPVILMLLEVTANAGQKIGTLIDLASDTNYITHRAARRLNLRSEKITLVVHGVGRMAMKVKTKRYLLRVRVKTPTGTERAHELVCYGLDEIAQVHRAIRPEQLKKFFPETSLEDLRRPERIELLISHREGRLAPQRVKVIGDLVLWEGPLGKAIGGAHPDLFEEVEMAAHTSETHFARSMRATAVKYQELTETKEFKAETKTTVANRDFLTGGNGTALEQLASRSVEDADAATVSQEAKK